MHNYVLNNYAFYYNDRIFNKIVVIMAEKRQYAPMSTAGLIRYFDEEESQIRIKPEYVVYFSIGFAALVLILRFLV